MTHITQKYSYSLESHLDKMIECSNFTDWIFIDICHNVQSLHIYIEKKDYFNSIKICYQDEGYNYHDVFNGTLEYTPSNKIIGYLTNKYEHDEKISVEYIADVFFTQ